MKYRAYVSIGEFETEAEAIEAVTPYEQDGESSIIKEIESEEL